MKKTITLFAFALLVSFAHGANQTVSDSSKAAFYSAFDALKNMLEGKDSLNYEKAVFITENAYYNNVLNYEGYKLVLDFYADMINSIAQTAREQNQDKYKTLRLYEQKMFNLNTLNWAIFKFLTDTTIILDKKFIFYKAPYNYTTQDPYGSDEWENTQVVNLLVGKMMGNCYALTSLFKIFSDRFKSDARLAITPHHIYIQNRNSRGDYKNVELATKTFPGDGSIQVLTYTTKTSIMNGMAQQPLSDKQAVVLNLIYLAKGFQHKFGDNSNDFLLKCADLAFKHDTLSMNALLLKAEVTENRLFQALKENKISTVIQAKTNLKTQKLLATYEKQLSNLYKCGYREIPKDIQHIILSAIQGNKDGYITTDKTPNPFAEFGGTTRYATLSGGLFDEMHYPVDTIQYFHASLNTKTKKILEFLPIDTNKNYKVDPVVFAMSVDPLAKKYPGISPYAFAANNPIFWMDKDGRDLYASNDADRQLVNSSVQLVLGDAQSLYAFNNQGKLEFHGTNYDPSNFTSEQNLFITEFNKTIVQNTSFNVYVHYEKKGVNVGDERKTKLGAFDPEQTEQTAPGIVDLYVNPSEKSQEGVIFDDLTKAGQQQAKSLTREQKETVEKENAPKISFWHGIGHALQFGKGREGKEHEQKTVGFENFIRKIVGLPERAGEKHGAIPSYSGSDPEWK